MQNETATNKHASKPASVIPFVQKKTNESLGFITDNDNLVENIADEIATKFIEGHELDKSLKDPLKLQAIMVLQNYSVA